MVPQNNLSTMKKESGEFLSRLPQTQTGTVDERTAMGKALRKQCSRKSHAEWNPPADRADPIDLLIENSRGRMEELVPIRYGRMAANPFAFYRGAAAIMAYDLSHTPSTGLNLQICGDCHLVNFGGFATAERRLVFDINDFDETSIAPWEWDVKRLTASFVIAGRANGFKGKDCREAARLAAQSYRQSMIQYASMPVLQTWYDYMNLEQIIANIKDKASKSFYTKKLAKAAGQSEKEKEFAELTVSADDSPRIVDQPPLIFHYTDTRSDPYLAQAEQGLSSYLASLSPELCVLFSRYTLVDTAIKVVGVGSVGTFCAIALFMSGNREPLFLQMKQARQSVLELYAGATPFSHAGQRVVVGQRLMQAASDMFLGWYTATADTKNQYYVRQLRDAKVKPVVEVMKPANLKGYAGLCGQALARAHARSGDAVVLAGYMGKGTAFEDAMTDFSLAYADQNERDHALLIEAIRAGRVESRMEE